MSEMIYQQIHKAVNNGILPEGFLLKQQEKDMWAPGAQDGVYIYHTNPAGLSEQQKDKLAEVIDSLSEENCEKTEKLFSQLLKTVRAIEVVDELQRGITRNSEKMDASNVFRNALYMMEISDEIECVKAGMEILELFNIVEKDVKQVIRELGLYDEFTLFSIWLMRHWENGNREIFDLASKVRGWGRIHAIEYLKPEDEEIRKWLLLEGIHNEVLSAYSALPCWQNSGAEQILFGNPTAEEFQGICDIIEGLLDEGPLSGISELENARGILSRFLRVASGYELSQQQLGTVRMIREWALNNETSGEIVEACDKIL